MELEIVKFIRENKNWQELLKAEPYNLDIKFDGEFALLAYNQIASNFSYRIVQECRGIIFHVPTLTPVCIPFFKFFNVQEGLASPIDWSTAKVQEKIDGSITKVWFFDEEWHVSTNGTINADNATLQTPNGEIKTYLDLFLSAENLPEDFLAQLDKRFTYIFEIVSPWNRVVIPYKQTEIYFIGCRNNTTYEEVDPALCDLDIQRPEEYSLKTIDECLAVAEKLPFEKEGYVVRDANFNRIKVKGMAYVAAHHLKNNGIVTKSRIVDMIRVNGQDDFISIYSEYTEMFSEIGDAIRKFTGLLHNDFEEMTKVYRTFATRKELAEWIKQKHCPPALFSLADGKYQTVSEWFWAQQNDKILQYIGVE